MEFVVVVAAATASFFSTEEDVCVAKLVEISDEKDPQRQSHRVAKILLLPGLNTGEMKVYSFDFSFNWLKKIKDSTSPWPLSSTREKYPRTAYLFISCRTKGTVSS